MYMYNAVSLHYSKHDQFHALLTSGFALQSQHGVSEILLTLLAVACRHFELNNKREPTDPFSLVQPLTSTTADHFNANRVQFGMSLE